ncbi:hypothetical protein J6590_065623 [Homalodisca vitripennis]|nr:hypothetical protein J6590_065623 [Homalodisca vitripennis]
MIIPRWEKTGIGSESSLPLARLWGVRQGSCIDPILLGEDIGQINSYLLSVSLWLVTNGLKLNTDKCTVLCMVPHIILHNLCENNPHIYQVVWHRRSLLATLVETFEDIFMSTSSSSHLDNLVYLLERDDYRSVRNRAGSNPVCDRPALYQYRPQYYAQTLYLVLLDKIPVQPVVLGGGQKNVKRGSGFSFINKCGP